MQNMRYSDIIRMNRVLGEQLSGEEYTIALLGNIVVAQLRDILEYSLRTEGINAHVTLGNYDNIVQDSAAFKNCHLVIIFWELANVVDGGQYVINAMSQAELEALEARIKGELDLVMSNLQGSSLVLVNTFSSMVFEHTRIDDTNFSRFSSLLNRYLSDNLERNVRLIELDNVLVAVSIEKAVDFRYYYSSRALYAIAFFKEYVKHIHPFALSANGKARKALILDCDNTLWQGILGEDGFTGIQMSPSTKSGSIFREVQVIIQDLGRRGVILGLCSKNNATDVDEVLRNHPDMILRDTDVLVRKVNWDDKVANLREIAQELNIGIDSLVFVDDSQFEVDYVREFLPEITVVKVPEALHEYPIRIRELRRLFHNLGETREDSLRTDMYRQQFMREKTRRGYGSITEYLASLGLGISVHIDNETLIPRIAQMTQKTNQFNLTTKRYTESDVEQFMRRTDAHVFAFEASDTFGHYGITGICIVTTGKPEAAVIDTFLMSCRVIGRKIEFAFFDHIVAFLREKGIVSLQSSYVRTLKNDQVSDLYEQLGFHMTDTHDSARRYRLDLKDYRHFQVPFIEVKYGGQA